MSPRDFTAKVTSAVTNIRTLLIGVAFIGGAVISANTVLYKYLHLPSQFDVLAGKVVHTETTVNDLHKDVQGVLAQISFITHQLTELTEAHTDSREETRDALAELRGELEAASRTIARLDERTRHTPQNR